MNIIFTICTFLIYLIFVIGYVTQINGKNKSYSEICEKASNEDESNVYCIKDHKRKSSVYVYKHILELLLERRQECNNDKIGFVENKCGEVNNFMTYKTFFEKVCSFSHSLDTYEGKGIESRKYDEDKNDGMFKLLGLYGSNSINWLVTDMGAMMSGVTTLVMHSKFSIDLIVDILKRTKLEWLCIDLELVEGLLVYVKELPHLKKLIILDTLVKYNGRDNNEKVNGYKNKNTNIDNNNNNNISNNNNNMKNESYKLCDIRKDVNLGSFECDNEKLEKLNVLKEKANEFGISILEFDMMTKVPKKPNMKIKNEDPNFIASIVYTSGTSGQPKGVMLSNKNFYNTIAPLCDHNVIKRLKPKIHFSYLPVSHVFERVFVYMSVILGIEINIWSKDISCFSKDLYNSDAVVVAGVPKVFTRIYTNIMTEINNLPSFKRSFVKRMLSLRKNFHNGCFDKLIEKCTNISYKIKNKINPELKMLLNGGGKLSSKIADELCILLDVDYFQGYGLTESTGALFVQNGDKYNTENIGGPISPNTKYKLRSWETYKANDNIPKGELLVKSDSMFNGYFLEREYSKKAFTHDGYFITGDVFQINKDGSLTFLDRSKGLVKLSQGEYIETDMLNNLYSEILFVNFCVAYGDDSMDGPLAIISVDKTILFKCLKEDNMLETTGLTEKNYSEKLIDQVLNESIYVDYVKAKMMEVYKKTNLNRYNVINDIYLTSKTWDTNNYLTPTAKVKRFKVFKDFSFYIDQVKKKYEDKLKGSGVDSKVSEKNGAKTEEKKKEKSEVKKEVKNEEKNEVKSEEKNEEKNEVKNQVKNEEKNEIKNQVKSEEKNEKKPKEGLTQTTISKPQKRTVLKREENNVQCNFPTNKKTLEKTNLKLRVPNVVELQVNA
ncbi:acyl-CoA synthetase [Plasmodium sp. gorilla clade G2]|uniref:acyl-CoA synthetase n=1 Tax=Plasmodium sp. gorilla clade G2 TaxID=880535 RepID=UPI000D21D1B1|nr:acyl-CoA synthetase [Plasmodium sp. gorilla clade G2]SOV11129.1 acyl-CoA synthetase [Plasmodium sp. gorilla clade G2]